MQKKLIFTKLMLRTILFAMLSFFFVGNICAQTNASGKRTVTGTVVDENNEPVPGAAVIVKGSTRGVVTDVDGTYTILSVSPTDNLEYSFLGMQSQTVMVGDRKVINIQMQPQANELDQVTVVAFGKQKKASVIGAITTIPANELQMPAAKLSSGLAGQLAGIVVMQRSGEPGAGADFWIRGISSFGANNTPLVLVDGIERSMDLVDPEDIASFSILKDATATALYGVRGANGIVLITTKRGKAGIPKVTARAEYGITQPLRLPKLAKAGDWIDYYNRISIESTGQLMYQPSEKEKYLNGSDPDLYPNVNWIDEIFKNIATNARVNVNVTGGSEKVRYYVGGSFYTEDGIFNIKNTDRYDATMRYSKYNFRSNVDLDITKTTELNLSLSTQYEVKNRPGTTLSRIYERAIITPSICMPMVYSDGTISRRDIGENMYNEINNYGYSQDFMLNAQSLVGITQDFSNMITPGLKANVKLSFDAYNASTIDRTIRPSTYYATGRDANGNLMFQQTYAGTDYMTMQKSYTGNRTINFEASVNYDRVFADKHTVGAMFLYTVRERNLTNPSSYIYSFPYRNIGIAGRVTYSYDNRYFGEFNFGYNGSENFAPKKQFGFFPSFAVGYIISNEHYFEKIKDIVTLLKIKASYGKIGNDQIGGSRRFAFNSEMNSGADGYYFGQNSPVWINGIATGVPGNPNVSWEEATKSNIGFELNLFNDLKTTFDYFYDKRTGIFIQQESVPSIVGNNVTQYVNLGKMKNQGFDLSIQYDKQLNKDWFVSLRGNYTFNRNKKLYDDKPTPIYPYQSEAGFAYMQQRGLVAMGLFESQEDIDSSPTQTFGFVRPGDIKYKDINGDGKIDSYDVVSIGYTTVPEINYGFGASLRYKNFDLSFFFQGVAHVTRIIGGVALYGATSNIVATGNLYEDVIKNCWTEDNPNPNARYPRMSMIKSENNVRASTYWQRDMSFLRLKTAEIGYTLPRKLTERIGMSTVRFFVQGSNLLTFSKFKLWDPEVSSDYGNVYPQMRMATIGLNINFK